MNEATNLSMSNRALQYLYLVAEKIRPVDIAGVNHLAKLYDVLTPIVQAYEYPLLDLSNERRALEGSIQHYQSKPEKKHDVVLQKIKDLQEKCDQIDKKVDEISDTIVEVSLPSLSLEYVKSQIELMLSENGVESKRPFQGKSVVSSMAELYAAIA